MQAHLITVIRASFVFLICLTIYGCGSGSSNSGGGGPNSNASDKSCQKNSENLYPDQNSSSHNLPYASGHSYIVGQGNCSNGSHNEGIGQQFAYDFVMPIGTTITASRDGTVSGVEQRFEDNNGRPGEENFIVISHKDGTASRYIHIMQDGSIVKIGKRVRQGMPIAYSGNTGNSSGPHLHFDVVSGRCLPTEFGCNTIPINFRNTSSHRNGLVEGEMYTAY